MAFVFSLEALLRFRKSLEHQEELLLQEANFQLTLLQRQVSDINSQLESLHKRLQHDLRQGLSAVELHLRNECGVTLMEHRTRLEQEAVRKDKLRRERMESFQIARRRREVVETLRQHQWQLYRQNEIRQEQHRLDDQFLSRRSFLRRS
jgi:flagellar export protein FliJ